MKVFLLCLLAVGAFAAPRGEFRVPRIVGGSPAAISDYPYQVSIQTAGDFHFCGGSLYLPNRVICAGHCVNNNDMPDNPDGLKVVCGSSLLNGADSNRQMQVISAIVRHRDYNDGQANTNNDIALLTLPADFRINQFVNVICLRNQGFQQSPGSLCEVSGWGDTTEGGSAPNELQVVTVPIVADQDCIDAYAPGNTVNPDTQICAGDLQNGGIDSCQGDSGGPMACSGCLIGIVSWGIGCARPGFPGVYTEVCNYINWINNN